MNSKTQNSFKIAWIVALALYLIQYGLRSAPSIMTDQLASTWGATPTDVISSAANFFLAYAVVSLVSGGILDKYGVKFPLTFGALCIAVGCVLFQIGGTQTIVPNIGRILQGTGAAFVFPAAVYLITKAFAPSKIASMVGITQSVGMLGGFAGQFVVSPLINGNIVSATIFWFSVGILILGITAAIFFSTPKEEISAERKKSSLFGPMATVFSKPQSILCGIISGLLFAPTVAFATGAAPKYFQMDLGFSVANAGMLASMVSLGWVIGCPIFGNLADRFGRKPVLAAGIIGMLIGMAIIWFGVPSYGASIAGFLILGICSGSAMIPYSMTKEINPDYAKGTATGVQNFLTFSIAYFSGQIFNKTILLNLPKSFLSINIDQFKYEGFLLWIIGTVIALVLTIIALKETKKN